MKSVNITFHCGRNEMKFRFGGYGMRLSHIFEIPSISNKKPSFRLEISDFDRTTRYFKSRFFEILGFFHIGFELFGISSEILSNSKKVLSTQFFIKNTTYF